jgi:hypothetical protein
MWWRWRDRLRRAQPFFKPALSSQTPTGLCVSAARVRSVDIPRRRRISPAIPPVGGLGRRRMARTSIACLGRIAAYFRGFTEQYPRACLLSHAKLC